MADCLLWATATADALICTPLCHTNVIRTSDTVRLGKFDTQNRTAVASRIDPSAGTTASITGAGGTRYVKAAGKTTCGRAGLLSKYNIGVFEPEFEPGISTRTSETKPKDCFQSRERERHETLMPNSTTISLQDTNEGKW